MENEKELLNSSTSEGQEEEIPEGLSPEEELEKVKEQNKKLFARAKRAEEAEKKLKESASLAKGDTKDEKTKVEEKGTTGTSSDLEKRFERVELQVKGFAEDEIDFIMSLGGKKALENEFVATTIQVMKDKKKSAEADPDGSTKATVYKKYTEEDLKNMSLKDLEKIIPR